MYILNFIILYKKNESGKNTTDIVKDLGFKLRHTS